MHSHVMTVASGKVSERPSTRDRTRVTHIARRSRTQEREDTFEDHSQVDAARTPTRVGAREQGFE